MLVLRAIVAVFRAIFTTKADLMVEKSGPSPTAQRPPEENTSATAPNTSLGLSNVAI